MGGGVCGSRGRDGAKYPKSGHEKNPVRPKKDRYRAMCGPRRGVFEATTGAGNQESGHQGDMSSASTHTEENGGRK